MKKHLLFILKCLALTVLVYGCIQPFAPPEVNNTDHFLVVDGFLNFGEDTTKITLSRTQNTTARTPFVMETGASVKVLGETGEIYPLKEQGKGKYFLAAKITNQSVKYKLSIVTKNGSEYESDFVKINKTPPIDSIGYKVDREKNEAVFFVNAHDSQNNTHFYRWKFEETWVYSTPFLSGLEVVGTTLQNKKIVDRTEAINTCYRTLNSGSILLGSTIRLSQDIIKELPLNHVPIASNKLYIKYSLLVRQYGLSQEEFEYWTSLAKTTQGTGSLFDPLPSQVTGNIKNKKDPQELVFGFFSATVEQKKRVFVTPGLGSYVICTTDTLSVGCPPRREKECALETGSLLISYADAFNSFVVVAEPTCVDCRLQGGVLKKPSFWQ